MFSSGYDFYLRSKDQPKLINDSIFDLTEGVKINAVREAHLTENNIEIGRAEVDQVIQQRVFPFLGINLAQISIRRF